MTLHWLPLRSAYTSLVAILLCIILFELGSYRGIFGSARDLLQKSEASSGYGGSRSDGTGQLDPHRSVIADIKVPHDIKVIGIVFFGRRDMVKVLDCYLKRNLKDHGGLLDQVIFTVHTDIEEDLAYLEELVKTSPRYSKHIQTKTYGEAAYTANWEAVTDPKAIYIKIDDDVVFIGNNTVSAVVRRILENPQYFAVSANVVNNPSLSWVHYHMGVHKPYWPEMTKPKSPPPPSWRASELPNYEGPPTGPEDFAKDGSTPAPYPGHRWLPVRSPDAAFVPENTPASTFTYSAFGPSLENWAAAAQSHYSFLQHLEAGDTWRYEFDTWDYSYTRLSINFFAIRGKDIMDAFPFFADDEWYLTQGRPEELKRHVVVDGKGLAVHFSFKNQYTAHGSHGLTETDLLGRYKAYADEMVCMNTFAA